MNIPTDIWYHIASYLPADILLKLQYLHPLFKEAVERAQYRALCLSEHTPERVLTELRCVVSVISCCEGAYIFPVILLSVI